MLRCIDLKAPPLHQPPHVRLHRVIDFTLLDGLRLSLGNRTLLSQFAPADAIARVNSADIPARIDATTA